MLSSLQSKTLAVTFLGSRHCTMHMRIAQLRIHYTYTYKMYSSPLKPRSPPNFSFSGKLQNIFLPHLADLAAAAKLYFRLSICVLKKIILSPAKFFRYYVRKPSPISSILSPVSHLPSLISGLLSPFSCLLSPISCLPSEPSPVFLLLFSVSGLLSPVSGIPSPGVGFGPTVYLSLAPQHRCFASLAMMCLFRQDIPDHPGKPAG